MEIFEDDCYWYCKANYIKDDEAEMQADATDINFEHFPPTLEQAQRHAVIRSAARTFAETIIDKTPGSHEQSISLRRIQEAVFWANDAIRLNEGQSGGD